MVPVCLDLYSPEWNDTLSAAILLEFHKSITQG